LDTRIRFDTTHLKLALAFNIKLCSPEYYAIRYCLQSSHQLHQNNAASPILFTTTDVIYATDSILLKQLDLLSGVAFPTLAIPIQR
jgi:hypothetical protein